MSLLPDRSAPTVLRASAVLTGSYVASTVFGDDVSGFPNGLDIYNQIDLNFTYTKGNVTSVNVKVEFSDDNSAWFPETFLSVSGADSTVSAPGVHNNAGDGNFHICYNNFNHRYLRVSIQGVTGGDFDDSLLGITAKAALI